MPRTRRSPSSGQPPADKPPTGSHFPVIGLGASAGGLEALEQFFRQLPADTGMAFILILHLSPTHKSLMPELIRRCTTMAVAEFEDGVRVLPNTVHIIPPNQDWAILHGRLQLLSQRTSPGAHHPIDSFFRTLAQDLGDKAIGIILSGAGADGTVGIRAIKGEGGLVMVQEPKTARYDSMPRSALETGLVDLVLPVEEMPQALLAYVKRYRIDRVTAATGRTTRNPSPSAEPALQKLFVQLRSHTGLDFSLYKTTTIMRRVERRLSLHQLEHLSDYVDFLRQSPAEIDLLFQDLLIGVTNFFRDAEAFGVLKREVLPHLFKNPSPDKSIRIWVAGCSTGEEAYSLAVICKEYLDEHDLYYKVQIFATDVDEKAIQTARLGIYPAAIAVDVSPERLQRYFDKRETTYQIRKTIRDTVVFAVQNLIKDPPFSRLDLISCRNLLIYMNSELQQSVLPLFHYVLRPEGILFLGSSESIGPFANRFTVFDKKWKLYKAKPGATLLDSLTTLERRAAPPAANAAAPPANAAVRPPAYAAMMSSFLLNRFAPPSVLIDAQGDILYVHGHTGQYLELAPGETRTNLFAMAREGLTVQLQASVGKSFADNTETTASNVRVKTNGSFQSVNLMVKPVYARPHNGPLAVVIFEENKPTTAAHAEETPEALSPVDPHYVLELELELKHSREDLQATLEEVEAANEELKSTNEELQSTNEELQSTNEELETSKEEMQSLNEELVTVNTELQSKIDALTDSHNDIINLLDSTHIPTIFLDDKLAIRRFTPEAVQVVNLIEADIGRPLAHLASNLKYQDVLSDIKGMQKTLIPVEKILQTADGHWYIMRIRPYRTANNVIDGAVLTFLDIDEQKRLDKALSESGAWFQAIFANAPIPIMLYTLEGEMLMVNRTFTEVTGYTLEDIPTDLIWLKKGQGLSDAETARTQAKDKALLEAGPPYVQQDLAIHTKSGETLQWRLIGAGAQVTPDGRQFVAVMAVDRSQVSAPSP